MSYETLEIETDGPIAVVTISRPKALNALNTTVLADLLACSSELEIDDQVRVVILTGAGDKAFVAGADITEMREMGVIEARAFSEAGGDLGRAIETSQKVWIAAVNGFALGGGTELALCCDFIYASQKAKFGQPEVKLGVIPGFGGTQRLPRRVGVAKAKEIVFSGDMLDAAEALRIGLADAVVAPDELMAYAKKKASTIAANGPVAVAEAKRAIHEGQSMTLEQAIVLEQRTFGELFATDDQKEGMTAFVEKRAAAFEGK